MSHPIKKKKHKIIFENREKIEKKKRLNMQLHPKIHFCTVELLLKIVRVV